MSFESLTIKERLLLHLSRFLEFSPEVIYNIPFDITQDGIASVLGISRAHSSLELKKLRDSGKAEEWLGHIKKSDTKRKVYHLLPNGVAEAELIKEKLAQDGTTVEEVLDMNRCAPDVKWTSLSEKDREMFGIACTFRRPVLRKELPDTASGVIPADYDGLIQIPAAVAQAFLENATDEQRKNWHSIAANWYIDHPYQKEGNTGMMFFDRLADRTESEKKRQSYMHEVVEEIYIAEEELAQEKLFHLVRSDRNNEACKHLIRNSELFLTVPNNDLLDIVGSMDVPPKFRESVYTIGSKLSVMCCDIASMKKFSELIRPYDGTLSGIVNAECHIAENRIDDAITICEELDIENSTLTITHAKALMEAGRFDDAKKRIEDYHKGLAESLDLSSVDELLITRAGIEYGTGNDLDCSKLLNKALSACHGQIQRNRILNLIERVDKGETDIDFTYCSRPRIPVEDKRARLHDLVENGRYVDAVRATIADRSYFTSSEDQNVFNDICNIDTYSMNDRLAVPLLKIRAEMAYRLEDMDDIDRCADLLSKHGAEIESRMALFKKDILAGGSKNVVTACSELYIDHHDPDIAITKTRAQIIIGDIGNAERTIGEAIRSFKDIDPSYIMEMWMLKAEIAYAKEDTNACANHLNKAASMCEDPALISKLKGMADDARNGSAVAF